MGVIAVVAALAVPGGAGSPSLDYADAKSAPAVADGEMAALLTELGEPQGENLLCCVAFCINTSCTICCDFPNEIPTCACNLFQAICTCK